MQSSPLHSRVLALLCTLFAFGLLSATPAQAQADLSGEMKDLSWIGFEQYKEVSRVFVRTTEPVKFRIDSSGQRTVVLILENTGISLKNNRRPLDTSHFDSPVRYINPKIIEGAGSTVRIEIYLREKVPFKQLQDDNFLALDFNR